MVLLSVVLLSVGSLTIAVVCCVNFHQETVAVQKEGGLASFFFVLLQQANAVARANVRALGGNALVGYRMNPRESSGLLSSRKVCAPLCARGGGGGVAWSGVVCGCVVLVLADLYIMETPAGVPHGQCQR